MPDGQSKIADGACAIGLHQDILRLEIPVGDGRLPLRTDDLHVKMRQPGSDRPSHPDHTVRVHGRSVQIIEQGALLVIVCDQPQLGPRPVICVPRKKRVQLYLR